MMSDRNFEELLRIYDALSDFYFDVEDEETTQEEREKLNDACEAIMDVLIAHADNERKAMLP